jgi:CheY-like chemotaxis protein
VLESPALARSILVVDDEPSVREAIRLNLESAGYSVECAVDGLDAARILERERFDVVLTDILMPNSDGLELIDRVHRYLPGQPIIAMTGGGSLEAEFYMRIARGFHVNGLLHKPLVIAELLSLLQTVAARERPDGRS